MAPRCGAPAAAAGLVVALLAAAVPAAGGVVTVHLVPHTHDDVGWLKTVDEYYTGQNNSIQHAYVKMVLDEVVMELHMNPDRRFTYVEQAFFQRWWNQQNDQVKNLTRRLVSEGRLEFTNGGWCMHDEAAPFYLDMIDQTTLGHRFLMDEFGVAPQTGWQLDPFGHTATQAALLSAEVGFSGLFFGRIDYQDLALRRKAKAAEFIWRASPSLGASAQVFTGLTGEYGGNYGPPPGFNWDQNGHDEPVQDDPTLEDYNVKSRVDDFVYQAMLEANATRGTNVMWTMGSDFQYENAHEWFDNMDKIIKYVNQDGRVRAQYSTPLTYLNAKRQEVDSVTWPLKTDDFMPYADGPNQFWTGYFTSRPALKRYVRDTSAFLQVVQQLSVGRPVLPGLLRLQKAQGVAQHHDAVSGTAKQHVTFDYAKRLARARADALLEVSQSLAFEPLIFCELRNVSVCAPTQAVGRLGSPGGTKEARMIIYNGLAQARAELVELPVGSSGVTLFELSGKAVESQLVPSLMSITNYGRDAGGSNQTLLFVAELPALGFKAFKLVAAGEQTVERHAEEPVSGNNPLSIENELVKLDFCDGLLCGMTDKPSGVRTKAEQSWFWYNASTDERQASGAYIFRPNGTAAFPVLEGGAKPSVTRVIRGPIASEVHQTFSSWVSQRIRLVKGMRHAEITYTVGEIPWQDGLGREVVSRISTDVQSNGECFTDSNGREMLRRKRDFRFSWALNQTEPVAGNYYPITTALFVRDASTQLTVLTETSQAGTGCVRDGELELMVHRRLFVDDRRGVSEPLNETEFTMPYVDSVPEEARGGHYGRGLIIRGRHWLTLGKPSESARVWRPLADQVYLPPMPFFFKPEVGEDSVLAQPLPPNVQLVTIAPWDEERLLLRLAHQFGAGEDAELSKPATVDLGSLFTRIRVTEVSERGLAATISREEVLRRRTPWKVEGEAAAPEAPAAASEGLSITLGPLQIRTFLVKFEFRAQEQELRSMWRRRAWDGGNRIEEPIQLIV